MHKIDLKKHIFVVWLFTVNLLADTGNYTQGINHYVNAEYKQAFPLIEAEAKQDNKAAQYRLAEMYENGLGTKIDYRKSAFWYKKAALKYAFTAPKKVKVKDTDSSLLTRLDEQISSDDSVESGSEFALAKMDTNTPETKKMLNSILDGDFFGFKPYNANYFMPLSWSKDNPRRVSSTIPLHDLSNSQYAEYNKNVEIEFQLSLRKQLTFDLFGMHESIDFAYTQKVWWQLYDESGPFRETNYQPEIFMTIPTTENIDESIGLKAVKLGFIHESNGQEGYRSRSWIVSMPQDYGNGIIYFYQRVFGIA